MANFIVKDTTIIDVQAHSKASIEFTVPDVITLADYEIRLICAADYSKGPIFTKNVTNQGITVNEQNFTINFSAQDFTNKHNSLLAEVILSNEDEEFIIAKIKFQILKKLVNE